MDEKSNDTNSQQRPWDLESGRWTFDGEAIRVAPLVSTPTKG